MYQRHIPYFSNPSISLGGAPLGVPSGTKSNCVAGSLSPDPTTCDANARAVINTTRTTSSQFRLSGYTWVGNSTAWNTASNWSNNRVPRYMDDITIPAAPAGGNFPTINGDFDIRNLIIANGAVLNMTGGTLNVYGDWEEQGSGLFNGSGGTVVFRSPLDQTIQAGSSSHFYHLQIGDGSGAQRVSLGSNIDVNGNLTILDGASLKGGGYIIEVAGDWTDNGASFEQGSSTVILDGAGQTVDKPATTTTLLYEPFEEADGKFCCSTAYLPGGWVREQAIGTGFLAGQKNDTTGAAFAWYDSPDAWLHSPSMHLKPGVTYQMEYKSRLLYAGPLKIFSVYLGKGQNSVDMTRLIDTTAAVATTYTTRSSTFTVASAGIYYLGFRAQQTTANVGVIDDISLTGEKQLTFYNLQIAGSASAALNTLTIVQNNLSVNDGGLLDLAGNVIKIDGVVSNAGVLQDSKPVSGGNVAFLQIMDSSDTTVKYRGVEVNAAGNLGLVTVKVSGRGAAEYCPFTGASSPVYAARCYDIAPTNNLAATVKLWALTGELNGIAQSALAAFHNSGSIWSELGARSTGNDGGSYAYAQGDLTSFSPFLLGETGASYNITLDEHVYLPMVIR
ncbi:choice-of-anchor J domain-containing protein [Chloroflexota bacterium]